jgi:hypothetical protein
MIPALDFIGMTDETLIDEAAKLHTLAKAIDAKLDEAKAIIRSRGMKEIYGTSFKATVGDTVVSWALDKTKITEAMGEAWVTKHSKQIVKAGSVSFKPYVALGDIKVA